MAQDGSPIDTLDTSSDASGYDAHELARPLRPPGFGRTRPTKIEDAVVEPAWPGVRVIASVSDGRASIYEQGERVELLGERVDLVDDVHDALHRAVKAVDGAIFDGYLTKQILTEGVGVPSWVNEYPTMTGQITRMFVGGRRSRVDSHDAIREKELADRDFGDEDAVNLVLTDLLWLDGQWLLDVPLLERRRVLEAIVEPGELVRAGPYVRYPIDSWVGSWRAQGFRGMTFKAANSRYRPGEASAEWTISDLPRR